MAEMATCACGWTVISPQGRDDVKKHTMLHLKDYHPGTVLSPDEMEKMIKSV
jgi:predicted small metal-binding protein